MVGGGQKSPGLPFGSRSCKWALHTKEAWELPWQPSGHDCTLFLQESRWILCRRTTITHTAQRSVEVFFSHLQNTLSRSE